MKKRLSLISLPISELADLRDIERRKNDATKVSEQSSTSSALFVLLTSTII